MNEKLKAACLKAELDNLKNIEGTEWTPSEKFENNMKTLLGEKSKKPSFVRRLTLISAAALIAALCVLPLSFLIKDTPAESLSPVESLCLSEEPELTDMKIKPAYVPEGYVLTAEEYGEAVMLSYSKGEDLMLFSATPAESVNTKNVASTDPAFSNFGEVIMSNSISRADSPAISGVFYCWNDENYFYTLSATEKLSDDEIQKIIASVKESE